MKLGQMFPKKHFDAIDLRDFAGEESVPVTIEKVDYRTIDSGEIGKAEVVWYLSVAELKKPIKINATSARQLEGILGSDDTDDWIGRVVGIRAVQVEAYGKWHWVVNFWNVGQRVPTLPMKTDLSGYSAWSRAEQDRLRGRLLTASSPNGAGAAGTPPAPIGPEAAAKIVVALKERGLGWEDLVASCRKQGAEDLIVGKEPGECPAALADVARVFCALHARTAPVADFAAEVAALVQAWAPPPAAAVAGEVVNPETGEVIDTSDIPF